MLDIHNILCVCVCERENAIVCNGFLCVWHLGIILPTASAVLFGVLQSAHSEQQALGMLYELWSILLSCVCGGCVEGVCVCEREKGMIERWSVCVCVCERERKGWCTDGVCERERDDVEGALYLNSRDCRMDGTPERLWTWLSHSPPFHPSLRGSYK